MGMNETPTGERVHIGFFGRRNAGKSSVLNAVIGQELAVVSDVKGTTTDPVYKSMELLPLGPVTVIDTPGIDDEGELGTLRVRKSYQVLNKTDVAVIVVDSQAGFGEQEEKLLNRMQEKQIPCVLVFNKMDQKNAVCPEKIKDIPVLGVSARTKAGITELKETIAKAAKTEAVSKPLVSDLLDPSDFVILVVPIDKAAPKGRLILPQQQTIRDILEAGAVSIVVKDNELKNTLENIGKKPKLVITDSQVFAQVSKVVSEEIPLTSFSILMARYKGLLEEAVQGVTAIDQLKDGDTVLISEGCTHHRQCDDIGTVKLPRLLRSYTGKELNIETSSGMGFPEDLSPYAMVIHCGGCMLNEREVRFRMKCAQDQGVPITNYGIAIAHMRGILKRSTQMLPQVRKILEKQ